MLNAHPPSLHKACTGGELHSPPRPCNTTPEELRKGHACLLLRRVAFLESVGQQWRSVTCPPGTVAIITAAVSNQWLSARLPGAHACGGDTLQAAAAPGV